MKTLSEVGDGVKPMGLRPSAALRPSRYWYPLILALCGFVTSFGAHIVATNLPAYAKTVGTVAFMIGVLIAVYDFAELFAQPVAGVVADRRGLKLTCPAALALCVLGAR